MTRIELIAECSTNHGGSVPLAKEFIRRFADAGAEWVKFQYTRVRHLRPDDPQYAWFAQAEFSDDQFAELKAETEACGAKFLLTAFHTADFAAILDLGCRVVKFGAGEADEPQFRGAQYFGFARVIRSIDFAGYPTWYDRVKDVPHDWLSTVSRYPASPRACLRAIERMGYYTIKGFSDHSVGTEMATLAMECGAKIIEKHVCLPHQARAVRPFEATIEEFKQLRKFADDDPSKFIGRWQHA